MHEIPFIFFGNSVQVFPPGLPPLSADSSHKHWDKIVDSIIRGNIQNVIDIINSTNQIINVANNYGFEFRGDHVVYKGRKLSNYMSKRLIEMHEAGLDLTHYQLFIENLFKNPSRTAVEEFFEFMERANLPITNDGCFLAYKAVDQNFKDYHTGTFDNSPGTKHSMPRNQVDDDRSQHCSTGFHAAAYKYAKNFLRPGGRMVCVKINPADVVSVPSDHDCQKIRVCAYEVLYEIEGAADTLTGEIFQPVTD